MSSSFGEKPGIVSRTACQTPSIHHPCPREDPRNRWRLQNRGCPHSSITCFSLTVLFTSKRIRQRTACTFKTLANAISTFLRTGWPHPSSRIGEAWGCGNGPVIDRGRCWHWCKGQGEGYISVVQLGIISARNVHCRSAFWLQQYASCLLFSLVNGWLKW